MVLLDDDVCDGGGEWCCVLREGGIDCVCDLKVDFVKMWCECVGVWVRMM